LTLSSDSRLATIASVTALLQTIPIVIPEKSGKVNSDGNCDNVCVIGTWTRCVSCSCQSGFTAPSSMLPKMPISTTTSGPGTKRSGPFLGFAPSHQNRKARLTPAIRIAPGVTAALRLSVIREKVLMPFAVENSKIPSASRSKPTACGICLRIRIRPIAASMPVMTDDGTNSLRIPARVSEKQIWSTPDSTTAIRNIW
jgi:hypothetical protein